MRKLNELQEKISTRDEIIKKLDDSVRSQDKVARRLRKAIIELAKRAGIEKAYEDRCYRYGYGIDIDLLVDDLLTSADDLEEYENMEAREIRLMGGVDDDGYTESD